MKNFTTVRSLATAIVAVAALSQGACNKPTPDECKKALTNMQELMGTEAVNTPASIASATRRCRGASKKESVACAAKATTLDELKQCSFYKELMSSSMFPDVPTPSKPVPAAPIPTPVTPPAGAPAAVTPTPTAPPAGTPTPTTPVVTPSYPGGK